MHARSVLVVMGLLPLLAGCVVVPEDGEAAPRSGPTLLAWKLTDCEVAIVLLPADAAAVQPHLPAGFTPVSFPDAGLPPDPRGTATVGVEGWSCKEGTTLDGSEAGMVFAQTFAMVHPPSALANSTSKFQFVKWDAAIPDAPRRAALHAAGANASEGAVRFTTFQESPAGVAAQGSFDLNGTYAFSALANAPATAIDPGMAKFDFTEFSPALRAGGFVVWHATVTLASGAEGGGDVSLPPGVLRDIVGSDTAQAYFLVGRASLDGTILIPGSPSATGR